MKHLLFTGLMALITLPGITQENLSHYFELKVQQIKEENETFISVSPQIRYNPKNEQLALINKYHRRFDYLLQNKTHFQGVYDKYYPDTNHINKLFIENISGNKEFVSYFDDFRHALVLKKEATKKYTRAEMMKVSSRFFYCDGVNPDSTISTHICIALNGVDEARWDKDYTLLEAFCFEAIFENYYIKEDVRNKFVDNFVAYVKEGTNNYRKEQGNKDTYLRKVRFFAFDKMEADQDLQKMLLQYFEKVRGTLPFVIE